jgi:hypothetical protein
MAAAVVLALGTALAAHAADGDRDRRGPGAGPEARQPGPAAAPRAPAPAFRAQPGRPPAQPRLRDAQGRQFDDRHGHDRYYPPRGAIFPVLPDGYRHYRHDGHSYFFHGGVWYEPRGTRFVVVRPPVGLLISVLPAFYTTLWFGGVPYYYADDVYYRWRPDLNGYLVVDPPDDGDRTPPPTSADDLYVYPKNGQSSAQQAADRYECHTWARSQTGFDPTEPQGGVPASETAQRRSDYRRAMTACLEARGYSVR